MTDDQQRDKLIDELNAAMDDMIKAGETSSGDAAGDVVATPLPYTMGSADVAATHMPDIDTSPAGYTTVYRGKERVIVPSKMDLSDARNEGFTHPESESTANLSGLSDGMRDYHNRLMEVLRTMQQILFDGIAELNEIQGRFNRIR